MKTTNKIYDEVIDFIMAKESVCYRNEIRPMLLNAHMNEEVTGSLERIMTIEFEMILKILSSRGINFITTPKFSEVGDCIEDVIYARISPDEPVDYDEILSEVLKTSLSIGAESVKESTSQPYTSHPNFHENPLMSDYLVVKYECHDQASCDAMEQVCREKLHLYGPYLCNHVIINNGNDRNDNTHEIHIYYDLSYFEKTPESSIIIPGLNNYLSKIEFCSNRKNIAVYIGHAFHERFMLMKYGNLETVDLYRSRITLCPTINFTSVDFIEVIKNIC